MCSLHDDDDADDDVVLLLQNITAEVKMDIDINFFFFFLFFFLCLQLLLTAPSVSRLVVRKGHAQTTPAPSSVSVTPTTSTRASVTHHGVRKSIKEHHLTCRHRHCVMALY